MTIPFPYEYPISPTHVFYKGTFGKTFISDITDATYRNIKNLTFRFWFFSIVSGIYIFIIALSALLTAYDTVGKFILVTIATSAFVTVFVLIFWFKDRSDDKKRVREKRIVAYIKMFPDHLGLYQYTGRYNLYNRIEYSDIEEVSKDMEEYFKEKGIKWEDKFGFSIKVSPNPIKYEGLFFPYKLPPEHLVRIRMKRHVNLIEQTKSIYAQNWALPLYPKEYKVKDIIVSIRPYDRDRFIYAMRKRISS